MSVRSIDPAIDVADEAPRVVTWTLNVVNACPSLPPSKTLTPYHKIALELEATKRALQDANARVRNAGKRIVELANQPALTPAQMRRELRGAMRALGAKADTPPASALED